MAAITLDRDSVADRRPRMEHTMPAIDHNRAKLTIGGSLGAADSWSVGLGIAFQTAPGSGVDLDLWLSSISTDILNWYTNIGRFSNVSHLDEARAYAYAAASRSAFAVGAFSFGHVAGTGSPKLPQQASLVCTLLTSLSGRSNRGRIYVPALTATIGADAQAGIADDTVIAEETATLITAINGSTQNAGSVQVVIVGNTYPFPAVSETRCDSIVDTQRPRARKQNASTVHSALV